MKTILSTAAAAASAVLFISDRIYLLPIPPEVAQWWPLVTAIAIAVVAFKHNDHVSDEDLERVLNAMIAVPRKRPELPPIPPATPLKTSVRIIKPIIAATAILGLSGCAEYAIRPSFEYRGRGISASVEYDGKAIRPKVLIYDKGQVDKELKGLAK